MIAMHKRFGTVTLLALIGLVLFAFAGCATIDVGNGLSRAIMNQDDPETVRDGAPAYLMLVDSFIESNPNDVDLLIAGAKLYAIYAGVFVESPERARRLAIRARSYGQRALCRKKALSCDLDELSYDQYTVTLARLGKSDVPALYAYALTWLVQVQLGDGSWSSLAVLPKIEAALERVLALDAAYENGNPQLYLGILNSLRPVAMGGNPEKGRDYFEQAISISDGMNLAVKVAYARYYARLIYDRDLHDRLLSEVLASEFEIPGLKLTNVLAKREATVLQESADDYF